MDLDQALGQFDVVDANLRRLDDVVTRYQELVPSGISFATGSPEERKADDLIAAFAEIAEALPAIDEWRITARLMELDDIARWRLDAEECGEPSLEIGLSTELGAASREVAGYRRRFDKQRRALVRERAQELVDEMDRALVAVVGQVERGAEEVDHPDWLSFRNSFTELRRLLGAASPATRHWADLQRHVNFGQGVDVHDIIDTDWPAVRGKVMDSLYSELEPLPVDVDDLSTLVAAKPSGPVSTALAWGSLNATGFERLIYNLVESATGYENVDWAMRTNAPDRGRDIAADRVFSDELSGTKRQRVSVQCKHWLAKSISARDVGNEVHTVKLWENPRVDVLIIATSGRFTQDAVSWIESHNARRELPVLEYWPESRLETLLAQRPGLATEFGLR